MPTLVAVLVATCLASDALAARVVAPTDVLDEGSIEVLGDLGSAATRARISEGAYFGPMEWRGRAAAASAGARVWGFSGMSFAVGVPVVLDTRAQQWELSAPGSTGAPSFGSEITSRPGLGDVSLAANWLAPLADGAIRLGPTTSFVLPTATGDNGVESVVYTIGGAFATAMATGDSAYFVTTSVTGGAGPAALAITTGPSIATEGWTLAPYASVGTSLGEDASALIAGGGLRFGIDLSPGLWLRLSAEHVAHAGAEGDLYGPNVRATTASIGLTAALFDLWGAD